MSRPVRSPAGRGWGLWRWLAVLVAVLVILVAAVAARAVTLTVPDVTVKVTHASAVTLAGSVPKPAWPSTGQAALAVDGIGSIGASGGQTPRPIASVAKVMTAYLILRRDPLRPRGHGFELTVTAADARAEAADAAQDQSVVAVSAGERLTERQLLEALLIPSGDNIARMLAAHQAGSDARFVAEMNHEARALGMDHTTYTDPSGFAASTVSTASDQLRIFRQAMRFPAFRQIVSMGRVTLPVAGTLGNYDPLLAEGYDGKTGSDSSAEGCLAFFKHETVGGRRLTVVGVVLGQGEGSDTSLILGAAGAAAQSLVASVLPALQVHTVLPAHTRVAVATAADGARADARTVDPLRVIGWGGLRDRLAIHVSAAATSLRSGQRIGSVSLAGRLPTPSGGATRTAVRTSHLLAEPGLSWRLGHVM